MTKLAPRSPKIYHIVHVDRLASIVAARRLFCDAAISRTGAIGTTIGMNSIKQRRLQNLLNSHADLHVGECVPFYFCPRSIMLYVIHRASHPELSYRGGQEPIIHLQADLRQSVAWAERKGLRWAFTLSNAGAAYFEDHCDLAELPGIDWEAVNSRRWSGDGVASAVKEGKQAEFLVEEFFSWRLVKRIGVCSQTVSRQVNAALNEATHKPLVEVNPEWYY